MDFSWSEILVVGIVALILIGPKDLPGMFRELGRFTAKIRAMGRDFNRALETAAKESGVKDVANDLRNISNPKAMGLDAIKSAADKFDKWDPLKPATPKPAAPAPALGPGLATTPATPLGPATAALAEAVQAKKVAAAERAAALATAKAQPAPVPTTAEPEGPVVKRGGRTRKPAAAAALEPTTEPAAILVPKPTPKPVKKPATKPGGNAT